jgi:hypothetical protein
MSNETSAFAMALQAGGHQAKHYLGYNLPPEDLGLLHPHWQTFEAPPFYYHLLLALIYFFLLVISASGNGIVVWIFST